MLVREWNPSALALWWKIILQPKFLISILRKLMKILREFGLKSIGMDFKSLGQDLRLEIFL